MLSRRMKALKSARTISLVNAELKANLSETLMLKKDRATQPF
jgi:hypothetical protein